MEEIIFPNQIRMIRRTRGKTMKEIASVLNVSLSAISKIEKGYRRIDDNQLSKIAQFLDCPKESIFVVEHTSQPEILQAWQKEQDRRKQINEKSGLKTLGAGLRYIRGEKMLTLQDVAKGAGLTLSVYHRIEMGQREVTEEQFKHIAHALGYTPETLQIEIYKLDMAGSLQDLKKTGKPGIFHPKGGYNDLPVSSVTMHFYQRIPVIAEAKSLTEITTNSQSPIQQIEPSFSNRASLYGILLSSSIADLPSQRTFLFADKSQRPQDGDMAVFHKDEHTLELGLCKKDETSELIFIPKGLTTGIKITKENTHYFDKITYIQIT